MNYMISDMRLSIFARLIIGYLLLFGMLTGLSLYFIYNLGQINQTTRSIIISDTSTFYHWVCDCAIKCFATTTYTCCGWGVDAVDGRGAQFL